MSISNADIQSYLQLVVTRLEKKHDLRDFYTPTLVKYSQGDHTCFNRSSKQKTSQDKKSETIEILVGLRKYSSEHVLLLGKPGFGKSTSLRRLLWEEAQHSIKVLMEGKEPRLPILIELRGCDEGSVFDWIRESIECQSQWIISKKSIKKLLSQQRLFLLFDGLNELASRKAWETLDKFRGREDAAQTSMVFTSREIGAGTSLGIERTLEMLPLKEAQTIKFIEKRLQGETHEILRQLRDSLKELAETPLLLMMLCKVFEECGEIPKNRGELFRSEFSRRYSNLKSSQSLPISDDSHYLTSDLLQYLAAEMIGLDSVGEFDLQISRPTAEQILEDFLKFKGETEPLSKSKVYLGDLLKYQLLQVNTKNKIQFHHHLFQEYYAAEWLCSQLKKLTDDQLKCHYLNYLKWTESISILMGFLDISQAIRLINLAWEVDWELGARLAGEVKSELQEQTIYHVSKYKISNLIKVELLKKTCSFSAIQYLHILLDDRDIDIRYEVIDAIDEIGQLIDKDEQEPVLSSFFKALADSEARIRNIAAYSLENLGNQAATPKLIEALKNEEIPDVRKSIISALGKLGDDSATPILLYFLNDSSSGIRLKIVEALGEIGHKSSILALSRALEDEDLDVRKTAAEALVKTGDATSVEYLLKALSSEDQEDESVRKYAAKALGRIGSKISDLKLFEKIETALEKAAYSNRINENSDIWSHAAFALVEIGGRCAFDELLRVLCQSGKTTGNEAILLLKNKFDIKSHIQKLISRVDHPLYGVTAAQDLGILCAVNKEAFCGVRKALTKGGKTAIGSIRLYSIKGLRAVSHLNLDQNELIPILLETLTDKSDAVREESARSLSKLNIESPPHELIETLIQGIDDENISVRYLSIEILGKLGSLEAVSKLIEAIKDKELRIQRKAIEALGRIGDRRAVRELVKSLQNNNERTRRYTISALGKINDRETIPGLVKAIEDSDRLNRKIAIMRLCDFNDRTAIPKLITILSSKDEAHGTLAFVVHALVNIGKKSVLEGKSIILLLRKTIDYEGNKNTLLSTEYFRIVANIFEEIGNPLAVSVLIKALNYESLEIRICAADVLGRIGDQMAINHLQKILEDNNQDDKLRQRVAIAIGNIGNSQDIEKSLKVLCLDSSSNVRREITRTIARINSGESDLAINSLLSHEDSSFRSDICKGLHKVNNEVAIRGLIKGYKDLDDSVRFMAIWGLEHLGKDINPQFLPVILKIIKASKEKKSLKLFKILSKIQNRCQYYNHKIYQETQLFSTQSLLTESRKNSSNNIQFVIEDLMLIVGDKFDNIQNATIINRSLLKNTFDKTKKEMDDDTVNALLKIANEVERSKNVEATVLLKKIIEELKAQQPDKLKLRQCWEGLITLFPNVATLTALGTKIADLFG